MAFNYKTDLNRYRRYFQSIEPILHKPRSRAYTTVIFSFLTVSLFGWYAIRPTIQTIFFLQREVADKTEINKKMEDKITALIEVQALYQEVEPLLPAVDQSLPNLPDAIPLVIQLKNLASASGTLLTSVQVPTVPLLGVEATPSGGKTSAGTAAGKQQTFDVSLSVRGPYQAIRAYLEGVLNMRRIATVEAMTVVPIRTEAASSQSATPSSRMLQLALKLKAYYLVE